MIEMYLLEQFVAFAQTGTLSGASEKLHISQPALSNSMKKIEDILGVSLFERKSNRLVLNENGKLASEIPYENGKLHGVVKQYYENGSLQAQVTYENGNIISMQNYTVDAFGSSAGFFIEYSYDEQGRVIERKNYNNYGTGLVLAGRIEYYYDETTGSLVTEKCYTVFWEGESMTSYIEYSYDRSGRLVKEDTYTDSNVSARIEYIYDEDGRLSEQLDYLLSENGTELVLSRKTDRTYDENGNILSVKGYQNQGTSSTPNWVADSETKFVYDMDRLAENVVYPYHMEKDFNYGLGSMQMDVFLESTNLLVQDSTYLEFEGAGWNLSDVVDYNYTEERPARPEPSAVESVDAADEISLVILCGRIYLYGVEEGAAVNVYDADGRILLSASYTEGGIPVNGMAPGMKIVRTGKFTGKFML